MNHPATTPPLRIPSRVRVVGAGGSRARGYTIQLSSEISLPNRFNFRSYFTGKEKDEETGYGYFGARYMDHELLTSFLSVDRYADKYPFISPYAYCEWNPIMLVDPDGREDGVFFGESAFFGLADNVDFYASVYSSSNENYYKEGYRGDAVDRVNVYRTELGLPTREAYKRSPYNGKLPFKKGDTVIWLNGFED